MTSMTDAAGTVAAMTPEQIEFLPWQPVAGCHGVHAKELWRSGDLVHAILRYGPDATTPGAPHTGAHQHIWLLAGEASIGGHRLTSGSYAHVPPGTPHPIRALSEGGCVLLQTHVRATP